MHIVMVMGGGLVLLLLFLLFGRLWGATAFSYALAATSFLPLWLALVVGNLWVGVLHAGYGIREELPILVLNFAVPAVLAFAAAWYFARP